MKIDLRKEKLIPCTGSITYYNRYVLIRIKVDEAEKKYSKENCKFDIMIGEEESFKEIGFESTLEVLRDLEKVVTDSWESRKSKPKLILFVNNLVLFNFFFKDDMYIESVIGSESIMMFETKCFKFVDIDCAAGGSNKEDFGGKEEEDWITIYNNFIIDNLKSVKLNQIGYSPSYINDCYFRANYKEAVKDMKEILGKPINYSHGNLLKMMCRNSAILHCDSKATSLYFEDIYAPDVTSLYPTCLLITQMPLGHAFEIEDCSLEKLNALINGNCCFDCEIRFKDKPQKKMNAIPDLQYFVLTEEKTKQYVYPLNEISIKYLIKYFDFDWEEGVITRLFCYKNKGYLPKSYCDAIVDLFYKKETLKKGSREQLNAKLAINGQIGKGAQDYLYLDSLIVVDGKISKNEEQVIDENSWSYRQINNVFERRYLCPQWSVRVYSRARMYVALAAEKIALTGGYNLYTDTDCHFFKAFNPDVNYEKIFEEIYSPIRKFLISRYGDKVSVVKENGRRKELGAWDFTYYKKFKYFKLKCYVGVKENGDIKITMGGCSKKASDRYMRTVDKDLRDLALEDINIGAEFCPNRVATYDDEEGTYCWQWVAYDIAKEGIDKILSERFREEERTI